MAQTEHLPTYEASYDLCLYLEQVVAKFARRHRYALGARFKGGRMLRLSRRLATALLPLHPEPPHIRRKAAHSISSRFQSDDVS
jgi:hypothetical protein